MIVRKYELRQEPNPQMHEVAKDFYPECVRVIGGKPYVISVESETDDVPKKMIPLVVIGTDKPKIEDSVDYYVDSFVVNGVELHLFVGK